jgi:lipopolysaccharide export system permease protein
MDNKRDRGSVDAFLAEAHNRIISPWNALNFTMIALAAILLGPFNRRGQHIKIIVAGSLVVLAQVLSLAFADIMKKHLGAVPLLYINTLLPMLLGFYFLHFRGEQAFMSLLRRWNTRHHRHERGVPA